MAWAESGTSCSRPAFMRSGESVHTRSSKWISDHTAPVASERRAAVNTMKRRTSLTTSGAEDARRASIAARILVWERFGR